MHLIKKYGLVAIGALVGVGAGYLYWQEIGCVTGTCPITSSPVSSSLYGGLMGGLLLSIIKKERIKKVEE